MKRFLFLLGIITIILTASSIAFTMIIEETPVCTNSANQLSPAVYGDRIVWIDGRNGNNDIYMYDLSTGIETPICTNTADQGNPAIYGDRIVWVDGRNGNNDIYMYDLSTGIETPICTNTADQGNPAIYDDRIVWVDYRNNSGGGVYPNTDIYMYDLSTGIETPICTNTAFQSLPAIYGNRVVWTDNRSGNNDIYMYDLSTGIETPICTARYYQGYPAIYGNRIVWYDIRDGMADIYMYDLSTGIEVPVLTGMNYRGSPKIYGDRIVWMDWRNRIYLSGELFTNSDIYMYDLSTGIETPICTNMANQNPPAIYDDRIVWTDHRNGNADIYMAQVYLTPQIISADPLTISPGELLTITGVNFGNSQYQDSQVLFANGVAAYIETWSNTQITCRIPGDAESGLLTVVTKGGQSNGILVDIETDEIPSKVQTSINVPATTCDFGQPAAIRVMLKSTDNASMINKQLEFYIGSALIGTATADAKGIANLNYTPSLPPDKYTLEVRYAGDAMYQSSTNSNHFIVKKKNK